MACNLIQMQLSGEQARTVGSSRSSTRPLRISPRRNRAIRSLVGNTAAAPSWLNGCNERMPDVITNNAPLRVLIAGGGLGGLFAAISLRKAGMEVVIVERTAKYRQFGGPIQLASNGVSTVKATSESLFRRLHEVSRPFWRTTSGIRDGMNGSWMFKFDAITELPNQYDLPFSICVDRSDLQEVLLEELQDIGILQMGTSLLCYHNEPENQGGGVTALLEDGREIHADVLIGADGIWSQVRAQMFNETAGAKGATSTASFTGYKLFSGLPLFKPSYYDDVGYSAFIGPDHYFVTCPDRAGRVQWYGFIKADKPNQAEALNSSVFLEETFKDWAPEVLELIRATDPKEIKSRDLWDRYPSIFRSWSDGCVTLLGDSCHATMPNIGQGAGLAFEDGFELARTLETVKQRSDVPEALRAFYRKRIFRTAAVQGLGRMNSEAIKILTPLLPIRPLVENVIGPILPLVFRLQFGYCYSFCPEKMSAVDARKLADEMRERHAAEAKEAWEKADEAGLRIEGVMPRQ